MTPESVVRTVADGVCRLVAGDLTPAERETQVEALAALYAEETDVRHPFAPGIRPLRSRAEVRDHFASTPRAARFDVVDPVLHQTGDPEVVVFEFAYATSEGRVGCVFVVRVRDGQIVESRDYGDHAAAARLLVPA